MKKVLIGGTYDIITTGHIVAIKTAKIAGDYLIVNVMPDNRTREKKGNERPIFPLVERKTIIYNIKGVDRVVSIPYKGGGKLKYEIELAKKIRPDIYFTQLQNKERKILENYCKRLKIEVITFPEVWGIEKLHTSDIINKIKGIKPY